MNGRAGEAVTASRVGIASDASAASCIGCAGYHVHDLTDERRFLLPFDLDLNADVPDHARPAPFGFDELRVQPHARSDRHGIGEADLLRPVVEAHNGVADGDNLAHE